LEYWLSQGEHPLIIEAKEGLVAGLLKVSPEFSAEKDSINDILDNINREFYELFLYDTPLPPSLTVQLEVRKERLVNSMEIVEEKLEAPSYVHDSLRDDFQAIQIAVENAHAINDEGQQYIAQVYSMIKSIAPITLSLSNWSRNIMALEENIQASARLVHTRLLAELARTGATADEIASLSRPDGTEQHGGIDAPSPITSTTQEFPVSEEPTGGMPYISDESLNDQQQALYQKINAWFELKEKQVAMLKQDLAPSITAAEKRIKELRTLRDSSLATLFQYQQTLSENVSQFNVLKSAYAPTYQGVKSDLALASTLIASVNVDAMNVKIQSCVI
jgi:hypothetical protein